MSPRRVWGGLLAAGGMYEFYALVNDTEGDTLSEVTRDVFRCHTRRGKIMFTIMYVGFSVWFLPHVAAKAYDVVEEVTPGLPGTPASRRRGCAHGRALLVRCLWPTGGSRPPSA